VVKVFTKGLISSGNTSFNSVVMGVRLSIEGLQKEETALFAEGMLYASLLSLKEVRMFIVVGIVTTNIIDGKARLLKNHMTATIARKSLKDSLAKLKVGNFYIALRLARISTMVN
jgi:hypothetical protein